MFYQLINYMRSPTGRRILAVLLLALLPIFVILSLVLGTVLHLLDFARNYGRDLKEMFKVEVYGFARDAFGVVRTGDYI